MTELSGIKPHDQAAAEIDAWRGRCLDLFARGERAVSQVLEAARSREGVIKIKHLASQRLADLRAFVADEEMTAKQRQAVEAALDAWSVVEAQRRHFAHGVAVGLLDREGSWHVRLDFTAYRASRGEACGWTLSQAEAGEFESALTCAFKALSAQLGQLKKRLAD